MPGKRLGLPKLEGLLVVCRQRMHDIALFALILLTDNNTLGSEHDNHSGKCN